MTAASASASPGKPALAALALHILEISRASFHLASVLASESGPHPPEKSQEPTIPSWLPCGLSRYSIPGSGAEKKPPSRGQGRGASLGPMVVSPGVRGLGNPVPLKAWGFCSSGYLHFWELAMLWKDRNEKQNPRAQHPPPLPAFLPLSHSQEPSTSASSWGHLGGVESRVM